ncbi:MAG: hypothetical protein NT047_06140 [Deltaproteobacteria bacterium]|nr:hypothetical protein [Deltaproteobacteria bacterium]
MTSSLNPVSVHVPYNVVFSDGPVTFDHFKKVVKSLSRTDTLFWCARLNLILSDPSLDEKTKQQQVLDCFFIGQQIEKLNMFVKAQGVPEHAGVVHRGTLLELIRWACLLCCDHPDDGNTFSKRETRETFAQALLMSNELWEQRVYGESAFEGSSIDEKRTNALGLFRRSLTETRCHPQQFDVLARGKKIFGESFPRFYAGFESEFLNRTGLSLDDYYICLYTIMAHYMNSHAKSGVGGKNDSGIFNLKIIQDSAPHMGKLFENFFSLLCITPDKLTAAFWPGEEEEPRAFECQYSLKPLRERPILKATDGRMIILDPVCLAEKANVGPLFHLMDPSTPKKTSDALFTAFGHAFETYVGSILQHIYPDSCPHLAKRLYADVRETKNNGIQVADFIIDDVSEIVIIEAKSIRLQDDKMSQSNPTVFVEHLRTRYGGEKAEQGYKQLARSIHKISAHEWHPAGIDLTRTKRVYPILLVHDGLLDAPVFGHYLAEEFRIQLQPDSLETSGWMVKGRFRVAPLVMMTIDDLECLETSLRKFTLVDLLKSYTASIPERLASLNNFLAANQDQFPLYRSESLISGSKAVCEESIRRVFPARADISIMEGTTVKGE